MATTNSVIDVLNRVSRGELTPEEGARLMESTETVARMAEEPIRPERLPSPAWRQVIWLAPMIPSVALTAASAMWMQQAYLAGGMGFRFWWMVFWLLIGVVGVVFSWQLRNAPWLLLNVVDPGTEGRTQRVHLVLPLPIRWTGVVLSWCKPWLPEEVNRLDLIDLMGAIENELTPETPLEVLVDEPDRGARVEVWIG